MFDPDNYELLDFGDGRKLERFGPHVIDRLSPAAEECAIRDPALWKTAVARFRRTNGEQGVWASRGTPLDVWTIRHESVTARVIFELKLTPFGHLGIFPEQAENWDWIATQVRQARRPLKVLNLFAYTGGSTLAAAAAGAEVVHVDAAKNVVEWARRNAVLSGLESAVIRWIAEDARKFVARELRRGNRYDAVILDPPSYGHGAQGEAWKLERDLLPLLQACGELTAERRAFMLLTCHSPNFGAAELQAALADAVFGHCQSGATAKPLFLRTADGRKLSAGIAARWPK
jgi:23S rRNA (cytosine1962-C5)-methyltransferase